MVIKIRKNIFETNSSSTHTLCIAKDNIDLNSLKNIQIDFIASDFGWEVKEVYDTAGYLYTALLNMERIDLIKRLIEILDSLSIKYTFFPDIIAEDFKMNNENYEFGYIDHYDELNEFIEAIFSNTSLLINFLFSENSIIFTGNDNTDYSLIKEEDFDNNLYEYFYKGN